MFRIHYLILKDYCYLYINNIEKKKNIIWNNLIYI